MGSRREPFVSCATTTWTWTTRPRPGKGWTLGLARAGVSRAAATWSSAAGPGPRGAVTAAWPAWACRQQPCGWLRRVARRATGRAIAAGRSSTGTPARRREEPAALSLASPQPCGSAARHLAGAAHQGLGWALLGQLGLIHALGPAPADHFKRADPRASTSIGSASRHPAPWVHHRCTAATTHSRCRISSKSRRAEW